MIVSYKNKIRQSLWLPYFVVPGGLEPPLAEPKSVVLPLHHGTIASAKVVFFYITSKFFTIFFFIFFSLCSHLFLWKIYLINIIIYYISNTYKSILSLLYCFLFSKKIFLFFSLLTFLLIPFYSFNNPYFTLLYLLFFNMPYLHFPFLLIIPKNIF